MPLIYYVALINIMFKFILLTNSKNWHKSLEISGHVTGTTRLDDCQPIFNESRTKVSRE